MNRTRWLAVTLLVAAVALAGCATPPEEAAEESAPVEEHTIVAPDDIEWQAGPPSLPDGARFAVLSGDPAAEGPFTLRIELPPGYLIAPHTHPGTEHVTLVSGSAFVGTGAEIDRGEATALSTGSFFVMPPGMEHYFFTADETAVLQLHGQGPWDIEYLDPADDPRGS